jgi:cell shape-determining protein MreC
MKFIKLFNWSALPWAWIAFILLALLVGASVARGETPEQYRRGFAAISQLAQQQQAKLISAQASVTTLTGQNISLYDTTVSQSTTISTQKEEITKEQEKVIVLQKENSITSKERDVSIDLCAFIFTLFIASRFYPITSKMGWQGILIEAGISIASYSGMYVLGRYALSYIVKAFPFI